MIKRYKVLIDSQWYGVRMNYKERDTLLEDINGIYNTNNTIRLENGDVIETGIVDDVFLIDDTQEFETDKKEDVKDLSIREVSFDNAIRSGCDIGFFNLLDGVDGDITFTNTETFIECMVNTYTNAKLVDMIKNQKFFIRTRG